MEKTRNPLDQGTTFLWMEQYGRLDERLANRLRDWTFGALLVVLAAGAATLLDMDRPSSGTSWARAALIYTL